MIKRLFDVLASALGLLILSPILAAVAFTIKITDPGPAFFTQARVGRRGKSFRMWKFRSMRVNAESMGPLLTVGGDPRITGIGRLLRKGKLDEFPQLWNVLKGEMSLVGPRPEVQSFVDHYSADDHRVLELRPGITDPASFAFYDEERMLSAAPDPHQFYLDHLGPAKIRINLEYAAKRTLWSDVVLITATVLKPLGLNVDIFKLLGLTRPPEVLP